ncbi:MAG TPA: hypothetical protein PKI15_01250 [Candidatus Cloacimonadota bacterium]|nr:hypothetical protein [Candidatus Cloacimonadota bacterium]
MKRYLIFLLILVPLLVVSCKKDKADRSPILAQVNDEVLTEAGFRTLFTDEEWKTLDAAKKKKYIEDWVNLTLISQEVDAQKLTSTPALKMRMEFAVKKVKANALISKRLAEIKVNDDELFNYFRIHRAEFENNLTDYSIQRILLNDKHTASDVLAKLKGGLDFDEAVNLYSQEPLKESKGMMGFVSKAGTDSLFWRACSGMEPNTPSLTNIGDKWYVFRITETRVGDGEANFEDYRELIRRKIVAEKEEEVYLELLKELKTKTDKIYYY